MSEEKIDEVSTQQTESSHKKRTTSWRTVGILLSAFSVVILILVAGYSGYYLLNNNAHLASIASQSQNQLQQMQSDISALKTANDSAQQAMQQSAADVKDLKQAMADFTKQSQGNQEKWIFIEARHYVKLAQMSLQFSHDVPQAVFLLKTADQELSHSSNANATAIRATLASDVATLQAMPSVDVAGLYLKLVALNKQIDQLPLQALPSNVQVLAPSPVQNESIWRRGWREIGKSLQNIVTIRHNVNGAMPLVTPEQKAFLYQNLHALVAEATWGLIHQQPAIYQTSLQQLAEWVQRYFVVDAPLTKAMLNDLVQLGKIDIHPVMPALTTTLTAFDGV